MQYCYFLFKKEGQDKPEEPSASYSLFYFVGAVIASLEHPHLFKWIVRFRYTEVSQNDRNSMA